MKQGLKNVQAWNANDHLNQVVKAMPPSGIRKFFDLVSEMEGAISLGVGEPDFITPWHVREACIYSLESGNTHYTSNKGMPELRECICDQAKKEMNLDYDPAEEILITTGVSEAVDLAFRATLNAGDEAIVPEPCYVAYTPDIVLAGGFPEAITRAPRQRARYFRSYVQTVLCRDLPEIGEVRIDPAKLEQLLRLFAARTSGVVNYAALGRELSLDDKTVKAHAELLRQLFLLYRLRPFSTNLGSRQVKTPKLLLADTGMAAALVGVDASRYSAPDQGAIAGMLFETFALMELVKQATWSATPVELFFYRDTDKREVDLVIEAASGDVVGIESKAAATANTSDARGLRLLRDKLGARFKAGIIIYSGEHTVPIADRIWALPLSGLWQ